MSVYINGQEAIIKSGSTFDYVAENRLFTEADDYSLAITFPLRDCPRNLRIFGPIARHGHTAVAAPFDMHIVAGGNSFHGSGVITSVTDEECKVQFLGGRSAENYYSDLDEVYVNNLDLGEVDQSLWFADDVSVAKAWAGHAGGMDVVAIPWVNEGTGNIQNNTRIRTPDDGPAPGGSSSGFTPGMDQVWQPPEEAEDLEEAGEQYRYRLSWFPYLIDIAKKICAAIGYSCDFRAWESSKFYHLLLCHSVPATWDYLWATLMPHWSVLEFFRNLEPLVEGEFDIDVDGRSITFTPYAERFASAPVVVLDRVLDAFSSEVYEKNEECKMISERYLGYASNDTKAGRAYSCEWLVRYFNTGGLCGSFDTPEELSAAAIAGKWSKYSSNQHRGTARPSYCHYVKSVDRYVSNRITTAPLYIPLPDGNSMAVTQVVRVPMMINQFGPRNVPPKKEDAESVDYTINFVPAVVDDTEQRRMLFVPLGDYQVKSADPLYDSDDSPIGEAIYDSVAMQMLEEGEDDGSDAYFSNMAIGFYPGASECLRGGNEIFPILDSVEFDLFWSPWYADYSLSLQDNAGKFAGFPKVNRLTKFEFEFLSPVMPDVRSVFHIRGHRYVCEKLTTSFSEYGMSEKIKGTFWRILD